MTFEQAAEKPFRGTLTAAALHENINGVAILIDRAPQILLFPVNGDKDFIKVPGITQATLSLFEFSRIVRSKLPAPLANGFVGDGDASFRQSLFDFTETQAEAMREPDGMTDNFGGEPVALVAELVGIHATEFGKSELN